MKSSLLIAVLSSLLLQVTAVSLDKRTLVEQSHSNTPENSLSKLHNCLDENIAKAQLESGNQDISPEKRKEIWLECFEITSATPDDSKDKLSIESDQLGNRPVSVQDCYKKLLQNAQAESEDFQITPEGEIDIWRKCFDLVSEVLQEKKLMFSPEGIPYLDISGVLPNLECHDWEYASSEESSCGEPELYEDMM
ncbi:hypothetical protein JCM33374_g628 [Metschnikowia sp. JCM 33374]|nr:hypothetical protein JCM33374_g628 [Metschnikowia sp. JCM 33374]